MTLRHMFYKNLDPTAWPGTGMSPLNKAIVVIVMLSVASTILETEKQIKDLNAIPFKIAHTAFALVFTVEYVLRLWSIGESKMYRGIMGRVRFALSLPSILDLCAVVPFYIGFIGSDAFLLRIGRVLRILTLAKLGRYSSAMRVLATAIKDRQYELLISLCFAGSVLLIAATALYLVEGPEQPEAFGSIPRALWWGVATLTTVGYGDVYPLTTAGKVIAGISAVAAIGVIAMPSGILAAAFSEAFRRRSEA